MTAYQTHLFQGSNHVTTSSDTQEFDLFVIGGGVNGCGIARDAAGRGLSVGLAEMGDLGAATSSASTKLFHGGLRYLEYLELRLVRESLVEREILLRAMPHISWPMRFVLPYSSDMRFEGGTPVSRLMTVLMPWMKGRRPGWLIRAGLFLYDHLGGRDILPATRSVNLRTDPVGAPLKPEFTKGYEYSDCWIEDSRLVVLNARDAAKRGAAIMPRTRVVGARRGGSRLACHPVSQLTGMAGSCTDAGECRRSLGWQYSRRCRRRQFDRSGSSGKRKPYRHPQAVRS